MFDLVSRAEDWMRAHPWQASFGYVGLLALALILYATLALRIGLESVVWIIPAALIAGGLSGLVMQWNAQRTTARREKK